MAQHTMVNKVKCIGGVLDGMKIEMRGFHVSIQANKVPKYYSDCNFENFIEDRYVHNYIDVYGSRIALYLWENNHDLVAPYINELMKPAF